MVRVIVEGFETTQQADDWASWYSNSGEQEFWCVCEEIEGMGGANAKSIEELPDGDILMKVEVYKEKD